MPSSVEFEEEPPLYKCQFCDIIFTSYPSVVKHRNQYCHLRKELPRSATVTSSTALEDFSTSEKSPGKKVLDGQSQDSDAVGVSKESSNCSDVLQASENAMVSYEDAADYLRKKLGIRQNFVTVTPLGGGKPCAKRKMAEVEQESKEGCSSMEDNKKAQKSLKQN